MKKIVKFLKRFFFKKERYVLHWSETFQAYQVDLINRNSKPFHGSYHSPSYFKGWAITENTDLVKLNKNEAALGGKHYSR